MQRKPARSLARDVRWRPRLAEFQWFERRRKSHGVPRQRVHFIVNGAEAQTVFKSSYGNAARNSLRDAMTNLGNFSLIKTVPLNERVNLQWHMTMLNVFNHSVDPLGTCSIALSNSVPVECLRTNPIGPSSSAAAARFGSSRIVKKMNLTLGNCS